MCASLCVCAIVLQGKRDCNTGVLQHRRWIWKMTWMDETWMEVQGCERDMTPHYSGFQVCKCISVCVCWDRGQGVQGCQMSNEFNRNPQAHLWTPLANMFVCLVLFSMIPKCCCMVCMMLTAAQFGIILDFLPMETPWNPKLDFHVFNQKIQPYHL